MAGYYDNYWKKNINGGVLNLPPQWSEENLEWHHDFFEKYIGESILDVGAGDGTFLNYLKAKSSSINNAIASEFSDEAIKIGKEKYPSIIFKQDKVEQLSFESLVFDTVFAVEVLEHLLDIDVCLQEINRVLKKGRYFCVTTTDFNWLKKILIAGLFWDKFFYPNNPHIRFFTKRTLVDICKKHGFQLVKYKWNKSYFGLMPKGQMIVFKKII